MQPLSWRKYPLGVWGGEAPPADDNCPEETPPAPGKWNAAAAALLICQILRQAGLKDGRERRISAVMQGFIYFNITDHARLPARFFGMTRNVLARL